MQFFVIFNDSSLTVEFQLLNHYVLVSLVYCLEERKFDDDRFKFKSSFVFTCINIVSIQMIIGNQMNGHRFALEIFLQGFGSGRFS